MKPSDSIGTASVTDSVVDRTSLINRIVAFLDAEYEAKQEEKPRWRAKKGEHYWALTSNFDLFEYSEENDTTDLKQFSIGNYFRTEEEAQAAAERVKLALLGGE